MSVYKRNSAVTGFPFALVSATDGSAVISGTVTGYITRDGGTQAAIAATPVHEGNGQWTVDLTAGEMNGENVGILFTHASAINAHFTLRTSTNDVQDTYDAVGVAQSDLDTITGADGVTLAGSQPNYAPNTVVPPSVAQFNARTLTAAAYFDPAVDTVAHVTLVDTCTTNTDMRGTDNANTVTPPTAAQIRVEMDTNSLDLNQILADIGALNDFNPVIDTVAHVTLVDTCTTNTDMRGTDGANTVTPPTAVQNRQEMDANSVDLNDILSIVSGLNDLSSADVNAQVLDVMNTDTFAELTSVPAAATTITNMLRLIYSLASNKLTQTATTQTLRNRLDTITVGTAGVSDDGTTGTRGSFS